MSKFHYLSSYDEMKWNVDTNGLVMCYRVKREKLTELGRHNIKYWIENNCQGDVYVWNEVDAPATGDLYWQEKVIPQGNARIYFTNEKDVTLFILKWKI